MVSLLDVQSSNSRIASALPPGLVSVFVGGTSGVGETSLKQFAKHTRQPRVHFVGRSQEAGDCIAAECKVLNSEGQYTIVKADTSLICTVDDICQDIKSKEKSVTLLFLSTGTFVTNVGMSAILSEWFNSHRERFIMVR
jgi:short-subunit dehydrogenase